MATEPESIAARVERLARFLVDEELESVCIERQGERFEVGRTAVVGGSISLEQSQQEASAPERRVEHIVSDRVGIFHFSRPIPKEGERIDGERELAFVEQLGIRNPIRSRGPGFIRAVLQRDGDLVDYGRPLFEFERT